MRLFVQFGALGLIRRLFCLMDQRVERLVAPLGKVVAIECVAAKQGAEPVVRITIVTAPANQHGAVFTILGALDVLAPFIADDLGADTDLLPVGLEHFGHQFGVGVVRALNRHCPKGNFGAFLDARFLEQLASLLGIVLGILDGGVVRPLGRRHGVDRQLTCTLVNRVDDLLLVDCHVQCLTHFQLSQRVWMVFALDLRHHVVGDVTQVEASLIRHLQILVGLEGGEVGRTRVSGDLAFVFLELLHAHRGVGGDGEDQVVDFDVLRLPVILVAGVADVGVFLVALEHERTSADRLLVDQFRLAFLEQLGGVLCGLDGREAHRHVLDERGVDLAQNELDGVVVDFFDLGDVGVHRHVGEVREFGRIRFAVRHVLVDHAIEGEQHVIGVEFAGRLEIGRGVELDAFTQMEGVRQAVFRDVPFCCQAWHNGGAATLKLAQTVEDGLGRGVEIGTCGVLTRIEAGRAALGAEHQVRCCVSERCTGEQAGADQKRNDRVFEHGCLSCCHF
ncbi:hypothetical protein ALO95_101273 [Pseudomonas syringae pv. antirrhini]|nr:hypothetical protein ALO95_101273 [Pseudomonas syringae pv. antirrhini]